MHLRPVVLKLYESERTYNTKSTCGRTLHELYVIIKLTCKSVASSKKRLMTVIIMSQQTSRVFVKKWYNVTFAFYIWIDFSRIFRSEPEKTLRCTTALGRTV